MLFGGSEGITRGRLVGVGVGAGVLVGVGVRVGGRSGSEPTGEVDVSSVFIPSALVASASLVLVGGIVLEGSSVGMGLVFVGEGASAISVSSADAVSDDAAVTVGETEPLFAKPFAARMTRAKHAPKMMKIATMRDGKLLNNLFTLESAAKFTWPAHFQLR